MATDSFITVIRLLIGHPPSVKIVMAISQPINDPFIMVEMVVILNLTDNKLMVDIAWFPLLLKTFLPILNVILGIVIIFRRSD